MSEILASRLRQARGSLSLSEAASRAGIPEARLRLYEEGARLPYGKTLRRLAEAYGTPVAELSPSATPAPAPAAPRQRRRRRRVTPAETGRQVIEIPVDVRDGEPIRLTLELILRPRSAGSAVGPSAQGETLPRLTDARSETPGPIPTVEVSLDGFRQAYDDFRRERR